MSKRKRRNSAPNLPQAALDRAREEVGNPAGENAETESPKQTIDREARRARRQEEKAAANARSSRRSRSPEVVQYSQRRKNSDAMDHDTLRQMLARPTKHVTEAELQAEYGRVVSDIRNMFVLAGVLMVMLVALAQFI